MAHLSMRGIFKRFSEDVVAVKDFNLEVRDREFVVLVGPSGCGKSTTLRMIAGLEEISEGELRIDDRVVNDVPPRHRDVAMVFQSYALYPHMSVFENMAFGLRLRRLPQAEIDSRVHDAAKTLGIEELLDRKPKALSGGQRQRVAMGRAIVRRPRIFLFDEPLSNLDAKLRVQMRAEIARLHKQLSATSIYVTHDQTEAMTLADRIVVMKDGVVQQVGSPLELYRTPKNMFVAGFIGSPSINFLEAKVRGASLEGPGFRIPLDALGHVGLEEGRAVCLGIRPESIVPAGEGVGRIEGRVDVVEPLGAEIFAYLQVGSSQFVGRFSPDTPLRPDSDLTLSVDARGCRLFDPATTEALPAADAAPGSPRG